MGQCFGRQRVVCEIATLDGETGNIGAGATECCHRARVTLDRVDRPRAGQSEGECAEAGKQIERRAAPTDRGDNLFDEDGFGGFARLQKGAGRERDGSPRAQYANRPALDYQDLPRARSPDDASQVAPVAEPRQRSERAESRWLRSLDQQIDTAVGAGQHRLGRTAGRQQIGDQSPQRADEREQWRLEHQALAQIDEIVAKPLAKPDPRRLPRIAWPREPEPGPSPHRRHLPQWRDRCRVDPDPFERIQEAGELDRLVEDRLDMLQRAPAAAAEMATGWRGASWTRVEQLDHPPFAAAATAGAEPGANAIARGGERQIDRLALPSRDAVGAGADSFDQQLDGPALRRRYH